MTEPSANQKQVIEWLAASYAKAVVNNPKDTIWANMERAVMDRPVVANAIDIYSRLTKISCGECDGTGVAHDPVTRNERTDGPVCTECNGTGV